MSDFLIKKQNFLTPPFPYSRSQRSSCLVRIQLYPDHQYMFIYAGPSVIRMMKSNVCIRLLAKMYPNF